jgi:hypothetical protein
MHRTAFLRALGASLVIALALAGAACNDGGTDASALLKKDQQLDDSERSALQEIVLENLNGLVFELRNPLSATTQLDLQYGANGRIKFVRDQDDVRVPNEQGETVAGLAVAMYHYTGEPLELCDGEKTDRERVVRYDTLFGNNYVSLAQSPPDYAGLTIAITDSESEDLGYDPELGARGFRVPIEGDSTSTIWYGGEDTILPLRFMISAAPGGLPVNLTPTDKETMKVPDGLIAPDCER